MGKLIGTAVAGFLMLSAPCIAELPPDRGDQVTELPALKPHWLWVNDPSIPSMLGGKSHLIDGDTGQYLGVLATGYSIENITIPRDYSRIYAAETYYSRGTRGERTDVVSIYDSKKLTFIDEIVIPSKRASGAPTPWYGVLTDDQAFMLVFNLTPATSLSVVDLVKRSFIGEIEIPGCSFALPAKIRTIASICGDGRLMLTKLKEDGTVDAQTKTKEFFDPSIDPININAVRYGDSYLFVSTEGVLHQADFSGDKVIHSKPWSLISDEERLAKWRIGGLQHLAIHEATGRLYALVLQGDRKQRKDPCLAIWVYDVRTRKRVSKIDLKEPALSIQVTQDDAPILVTASYGSPDVQVYDGLSGLHRRTVAGVGLTPSIVQTIPR